VAGTFPEKEGGTGLSRAGTQKPLERKKGDKKPCSRRAQWTKINEKTETSTSSEEKSIKKRGTTNSSLLRGKSEKKQTADG